MLVFLFGKGGENGSCQSCNMASSSRFECEVFFKKKNSDFFLIPFLFGSIACVRFIFLPVSKGDEKRIKRAWPFTSWYKLIFYCGGRRILISLSFFSGKFLFSRNASILLSTKSQGKHTGEGLFYVNNFMSFVGKSVSTTVCFALEKASNPFRDLWLTLIARLRESDSAWQKILKLLLWVKRARKQRC